VITAESRATVTSVVYPSNRAGVAPASCAASTVPIQIPIVTSPLATLITAAPCRGSRGTTAASRRVSTLVVVTSSAHKLAAKTPTYSRNRGLNAAPTAIVRYAYNSQACAVCMTTTLTAGHDSADFDSCHLR
jgi:hypothetical protein